MKKRIDRILIWIYMVVKRRKYDRIIRYLFRKSKLRHQSLDPATLQNHLALWKPLSHCVNTRWIGYFCFMTGINDERFVPPDVYYNRLEPVLNNSKESRSYSNKNFYDVLYHGINKPVVYIRHIGGCFYDRHYQSIEQKEEDSARLSESLFDPGVDRLIIKPAVESGQGKDVRLLLLHDFHLTDHEGHPVTLATLRQKYQCDFVIQAYVYQHEITARFNPSSLNSVRVFTYRSIMDDTIIPLHVMQRIGAPGSLIDGSLSLGIDQNGFYQPHCFDLKGNKYSTINDIQLDKLGRFPFIRELTDFAAAVAERNIHSRLLGIDLAVNRGGQIMLIEVNNQSIGVHKTQLSGGPLFREYTEEVIEYCKNKKSTLVLYVG